MRAQNRRTQTPAPRKNPRLVYGLCAIAAGLLVAGICFVFLTSNSESKQTSQASVASQEPPANANVPATSQSTLSNHTDQKGPSANETLKENAMPAEGATSLQNVEQPNPEKLVADSNTSDHEWTRSEHRIEVPDDSPGIQMITPDIFSSYAATISSSGKIYLFNLSTEGVARQFQLPVRTTFSGTSMSADGQRFAIHGGVDAAGPDSLRRVQVWLMSSGSLESQIDLGSTGSRVLWTGFSSPGKLIALMATMVKKQQSKNDLVLPGISTLSGRQLSLIDTASGKQVASYTFKEDAAPDSAILSPNGRYIYAVVNFPKRAIFVIDSTTLQMAAQFLPGDNFPAEPSIMSMSLSFDGSKLAMLMQDDKSLQVIVCDSLTGKALNRFPLMQTYEEIQSAYLPRRIDWLPDNLHLVTFHRFILDSATGESKGEIQSQGSSTFRQLIGWGICSLQTTPQRAFEFSPVNLK
ncbi:MAG: YncE family protein [Planctomyces sp.]